MSEEEQLERIASWWKENGAMLLVGIVVVVGGFVGWRWYQSSTQAANEAASDLYAVYQEADGEARTVALAELAASAPGSSYHALALFEEAAALVQDADLEAAAALYQQVLDDPSDALIADLARLRQAATLQGLDRSEEALRLLDAIRSAGYRRAALEMKGDIHVARGERAKAHTAYTQAIEAAGEGAQTQLLTLKAANTEGAEPSAPARPVAEAPSAADASGEDNPADDNPADEAAAEGSATEDEQTAQTAEDAP
jgi:predicted negative regulator of RcsB-dependent stress response